MEAMMDGITPKLFDDKRIMYGIIWINRKNKQYCDQLDEGERCEVGPSYSTEDGFVVESDEGLIEMIPERYLFLCTDLRVMFPDLK
jgi:hypothetical protein